MKRLLLAMLLGWSGAAVGGGWVPLPGPAGIGEVIGVRHASVAGEVWINTVYNHIKGVGRYSYNQSIVLYRVYRSLPR